MFQGQVSLAKSMGHLKQGLGVYDCKPEVLMSNAWEGGTPQILLRLKPGYLDFSVLPCSALSFTNTITLCASAPQTKS